MSTVYGLQAPVLLVRRSTGRTSGAQADGLRLSLLVVLLGMATAAPGLAASEGVATDAKTPSTATGERGAEAATTTAVPVSPVAGPPLVASGEGLTSDTLLGGAVPWASLPAPPALGGAMVQGGGGGGPTFEYYALDALGSVRVVFDAAGAVKARADYEPFGAPITASTSGPLPREQFTGQQRDSEVGLDYFGARFYHATHGRMLSVDPLSVGAMADPQRWNRYAYALNSPQTMVDPDGRVAQCKSILINYWYEYDGMHLIHQSYHDECTGGTYPGRGGGGQLPPGVPKPAPPGETPDDPIAVDPDPKTDNDDDDCISPGPPGTDATTIRRNAEFARAYGLGQVLSPGGNPLGGFGSTLGFLVDSFGPYGVWDYKEYVPNPAHQRYGNQNFGAVMHHLGVSRYGAQSIAGVVQTVTDAWSGEKYGRGLNYVWPTYGDAPGDSADIAAGWDFAAAGFKCK